MIKLDQKDRKIIAILSVNARATYSQIGKKTKLSKDTIAYRIKRLETEGIISGYTAFFDFSCIGTRVYKLFLKFKGLTEEEQNKINSYLKNEKRVGWIVEGNGTWDMIIGINTNKVEDFYNFKLEFEQKFHSKISESKTNTQIQAYLYPRNYLFPMPKEEIILYSQKSLFNLDEKDRKIMKELAINSRSSILDIAKKTNLSIRTVSYRIRQLQKEKIILQYRCSLNLEKIGYTFIKAFIKLQDTTPEKRKSILDFFCNNENIVHNVESLGEWELEPEFEVENVEKFYQIINSFRTRFSQNVQKIDSMIINREHKYRYIP